MLSVKTSRAAEMSIRNSNGAGNRKALRLVDMQVAGNTLKARATNEVKYCSQGGDPYGFNVSRMDAIDVICETIR